MRDGGAPQRRQKGSANATLGHSARESESGRPKNANARVWLAAALDAMREGAKAARIVDGRTSWLAALDGDAWGTRIT